jgi:4-hydroxy-tetrahydrodipicolinate synthase
MSVLSGEDRFCPIHMSLGAVGGVLASATLVPWHWKKILKLLEQRDLQGALVEQYKLWPLFDAIYRETNPGPMKTALDLLGIDAGEPLLPLKTASRETREKMSEALTQLRANGLRLL